MIVITCNYQIYTPTFLHFVMAIAGVFLAVIPVWGRRWLIANLGKIDLSAWERLKVSTVITTGAPLNTITFNNIVGVDIIVDIGFGGNMSTHDNGSLWLVLADKSTHFFELAQIRHNCTNTHDVVGIMLDLVYKTVSGGIIKERTGCIDILLNH